MRASVSAFYLPFLVTTGLQAQVPGQAGLDAAGAAPLIWAECQTGQVEVLIFGTFHFAQARDVDVLDPARQSEIEGIIDRLVDWAPQHVAVEYPYARQVALDSAYTRFPDQSDGIDSRNEIVQVGFRLARRLGHERVHAVDVPMNLWHDSIAVFDDTWPTSRDSLRARWPQRFTDHPMDRTSLPLAEILRGLNRDAVPGNSKMYGGFLPLLQDDVYAGALKLRPWYDRNLRIVQNLFRVADPSGDRVLLVIGVGHLRVLKQIMEITPQLCPVSLLPMLDRAVGLP